MQDADNLAWKLALVLHGQAPERLLDSYDEERLVAAEENVRHSTRSTEFITPKNEASRVWRDAVLALAEHHPFARRLINSGRLSTPTHLGFSRLNTPDDPVFASGPGPGSPSADAPLERDGRPCWLLDQLASEFTLLLFLERGAQLGVGQGRALAALSKGEVPVETRVIVAERPGSPTIPGLSCLHDVESLAGRHYDAMPGAVYLVRPDQHVTARWRRLDLEAVRAAVDRALGAAAPAALSLVGE
jgi:3-(3-hydroxy-phenyl)propionate hydroxylase